MSTYTSLAIICAGYRLAGCGVAQSPLRTDFPGIPCGVCGEACEQLDSVTLWIDFRLHPLSFWSVHRRCIKGIPLQSTTGRVSNEIDPQWALRGLAMVCEGHAMIGPAPKATECTTEFDVGCFACSRSLDDDAIEILNGIYCRAKLHRECFEPFEAERDRIIEVHNRRCISKVYMLPLGDCRVVIVRKLMRLRSYEEIFRDMFTTAP
jgi:hypothetical protein